MINFNQRFHSQLNTHPCPSSLCRSVFHGALLAVRLANCAGEYGGEASLCGYPTDFRLSLTVMWVFEVPISCLKGQKYIRLRTYNKDSIGRDITLAQDASKVTT
jgi:hypothetical protein